MITVILNLTIFVGILYILYVLKKRRMSFSKRVFIALGIGIVFGGALQWLYGATGDVIDVTTSWMNVVGTGYVKLLQMIAMPLIFISIIVAFTKMTIGKNLGKIATLILTILLGTTALSALVGIGTSVVFDLDASSILQGEAEMNRGLSMEERSSAVEGQTLPDQLIELLPANPFLDLTGARSTSTIAVVIFSTFIGFGYLALQRKEEETAQLVKKGIDAMYVLIMEIVKIVLRLTPYGIVAIIARTVATSDFDAIVNLGKFVLASYVALSIMFIVHLLLLFMNGLNPIQYVKKSAEALLFAFTSRSSAGTLPLNIQTQTNRLGVPEGIANFSASFGLSIGQNGCAGVYPAMLAVMIAPAMNINPLDITFIATVVLIVTISSFGVAGVGGGATFAAILVLSALDFPIALAGVLISVEPLIDMGRTALNVNGSMTAGVVTAKRLHTLDQNTYDDRTYTSQEVL